MLSELRIKNLALIESMALSFDRDCHHGLVVMTGETGAGKSIMLRAIHLLTGGRASQNWMRNGADLCEIEALFELNPKHHHLLRKLEEGGFGSEPLVVIRRTINSSGRSRIYVNGSLATARTVANLAMDMLNVASQHDHQQLLQPALHLDFIDTLGEHWEDRNTLSRMYERWQEKKRQLSRLRMDEQEKEQRRDFLKFQVNEIEEAELVAGEDEFLAAEKKRLKNGDTLIKVSQESYRLLSVQLMDGLVRLRQNMEQLAALDPKAEKLAEDLSDYSYLAEDHVQELRQYRDSIETDPHRLDVVNERLDMVRRLKRKYGENLEDILDFCARGRHELEGLDNLETDIARLQDEAASLEKEVCSHAEQLSEKRKETAIKVEAAMERELESLAFGQARFFVQWSEVEKIPETMRSTGWDRGEFFFCANPGEPPRPLAKVASGGELSRLMLALKCLLARKDMVETVIFDEVDAGIGGEAAEAVARKIRELAEHHQVICITHLPQIAARGTEHFLVAKEVDGGRTQSEVVRLSQNSRIDELMRMLAGDSATAKTRAWAEQMLDSGGSTS